MTQWGKFGEKFLYEINIQGTKNILKQSIKAKARCLVFASTTEIYGAQFKYPLEEDGKKKFTDHIVARNGNVKIYFWRHTGKEI